MAVIQDATTPANTLRLGSVATGDGAAHFVQKPIPHGAFGHYQTNHRCAIVATQAANSRLFSIRNSGTGLIIPTRMVVKWLPTAAHTAVIEDSIDLYKVTGFTVNDTTNTVTPTASVKRLAGMAGAPGNAQLRGVTVAGAAAGMTGGTLTKDANSIGQLPQWFQITLGTAAPIYPVMSDMLDDVNGTSPFVLAQNEGMILENRVLLGAAAGSSVYIDFSWAEAAAF